MIVAHPIDCLFLSLFRSCRVLSTRSRVCSKSGAWRDALRNRFCIGKCFQTRPETMLPATVCEQKQRSEPCLFSWRLSSIEFTRCPTNSVFRYHSIVSRTSNKELENKQNLLLNRFYVLARSKSNCRYTLPC